jgi:putative glutamine amidotransferase
MSIRFSFRYLHEKNLIMTAYQLKFRAVIIALVVLALIGACQNIQNDAINDVAVFEAGQKHIVIMHPTVNNLKTFIYLTSEGIFPLPKDIRVVGVFHEKARYDYTLSSDFIKEEQIANISLLGIGSVLSDKEIFGQNQWTSTFTEIFENSEGILFFGGPDLPPATYGQEMNLLTVVTDPNRHYLELSFLFHLLGGFQDEGFVPLLEQKPDYPILGICLGMQTMNVATGGSMIQDIPTQIYGFTNVEDVLNADQQLRHRNYNTNYSLDANVTSDNYHQILITGGHIQEINSAIGVNPFVLSSHHQAALNIGKGLYVTATSLDGKVVEALEHEKYPHVIGVQFHPEVRDLYMVDSKINEKPFEPGKYSYLELYPGEQGEQFHRNFWKQIAAWYGIDTPKNID